MMLLSLVGSNSRMIERMKNKSPQTIVDMFCLSRLAAAALRARPDLELVPELVGQLGPAASRVNLELGRPFRCGVGTLLASVVSQGLHSFFDGCVPQSVEIQEARCPASLRSIGTVTVAILAVKLERRRESIVCGAPLLVLVVFRAQIVAAATC